MFGGRQIQFLITDSPFQLQFEFVLFGGLIYAEKDYLLHV